jgi:cell division initiation protein
MITPLDIRKLEFNRSFRGYNEDEVRAALDSIAKETEEAIRENTQLKERLKALEERVNQYKLLEGTLQDSVITLQKMTEEKKAVAEQEASLIIQEAKQKASAETTEYSEKIHTLKKDIQDLEDKKASYFARFKNFVSGQLEWLEAMEETHKETHKEVL